LRFGLTYDKFFVSGYPKLKRQHTHISGALKIGSREYSNDLSRFCQKDMTAKRIADDTFYIVT
jgi:hypothetical protein